MSQLYVIDTSSFIDYFDDVFHRPHRLSLRTRRVINLAFNTQPGEIKLSIPSIVLVEIYEKWLINEEFASKFYYEIYNKIIQSPNIEIKPIEREVLEHLIMIGGNLIGHDIHDKIILSSAMMLKCPLITKDPEIIKYVNDYHVIPGIMN